MAEIPDTTAAEQQIVKCTLHERHSEGLAILLPAAEIGSRPADRVLTVRKPAEHRHSRRFEQIGAGDAEYDGLAERTISVRQARAGPIAEEHGDLPTMG
jgi:hypothetical protein